MQDGLEAVGTLLGSLNPVIEAMPLCLSRGTAAVFGLGDIPGFCSMTRTFVSQHLRL